MAPPDIDSSFFLGSAGVPGTPPEQGIKLRPRLSGFPATTARHVPLATESRSTRRNSAASSPPRDPPGSPGTGCSPAGRRADSCGSSAGRCGSCRTRSRAGSARRGAPGRRSSATGGKACGEAAARPPDRQARRPGQLARASRITQLKLTTTARRPSVRRRSAACLLPCAGRSRTARGGGSSRGRRTTPRPRSACRRPCRARSAS